jgi:hypothetical protein
MLHHHLLSLGSLAALGLLMGCDQTASVSPSATSLPGAPAAANASRPRPWKESYRATGTIAPDARCPAPLLRESDAGGGTATHIGRYTITNSHCVDPSTGALTGGSFVKTAANGDQIFGTYVGTATVIQPPSPVGIFRVSGTVTFTGGTGRFAGASGTTNMAGTERADFSQAPVPTQVTLTMVGKISY